MDYASVMPYAVFTAGIFLKQCPGLTDTLHVPTHCAWLTGSIVSASLGFLSATTNFNVCGEALAAERPFRTALVEEVNATH